ncbi:rhodanese-like domain-containing protein [Endozoicomonas sp.]|uniref:rhodanese-like domain-containing protein n=1 Tax=Endozoicomonas sp. TaxID=1892382 RepID=UPI002887CC58|nr:rhodanese-like domain-containing protein [Endozoicomonas sp.]
MEPLKRVLRETFALCFRAALFSTSLFFITTLNGCRMIDQDNTHYPLEEVSLSQLKQWQANSQPLLIIDTRSDHFFNGWPAGKDIKQGHIKGAISFQPHWLDLVSGLGFGALKKQHQLLSRKGITSDQTLVIYDNDDGASNKSSDKLYQQLKQLGYEQVYRLKGGIKAWGDAGYETVVLPRYRQLVHPQWLQQQLTLTGNQRPVILEVGQDAQFHYFTGHIPSAVYLETTDIEWNQGTPSWNFVPDSRLTSVLTQYGIDKETTVVVYADNLAMGAYRAALALLYSGVSDVRVLNGGKQAWQDQGYALETGKRYPEPSDNPTLEVANNSNFVINIPQARALPDNPNAILASVMTRDEFDGKKPGYTYYSKAGHIPGAILLENGDSAYDMLNYQDIDGTMRAWTEIETMWNEKGISADKEVSFYCGTGWRASEAFFAAYLMGWKKISVFDDGWIGWSMDPANPTIPEKSSQTSQ